MGRFRIAAAALCLALVGAVGPLVGSPSAAAGAPAGTPTERGVPVPRGVTSPAVIFDDSNGPADPAIANGARARPAASFKLALAPRTAAGGVVNGPMQGASLPDPEVLGFAQTAEITSGDWQQDFNFSLLTTVAYAFIHANQDGTLDTNDSGWSGFWSGQATSMIDAAHAAGDRVVVSISDFGASCSRSCANALLASPTARQTLVSGIISQISSRGIDGVNIDFENASDTTDFTSLIAELRAELQTHIAQSSYLSVDSFASAYQGGELWNLAALAPYIDAIMPMAYVMNGSTLPGAPINANPAYAYTVTGVINGYLASGVPASELVLGVPYYGMVYSTGSSEAFNAPVGGDGYITAVPYYNVLYDLSCSAAAPDNLVQNWAPSAKSPWAAWWSPASGDPCGGNHNSYRELYYENAQSLSDKYALVASDGLRGIGIWSLGYDRGSNDLWNAIAQSFSVNHGPVATISALPATESSATFSVCWTVQGSAGHSILWARDGNGAWAEVTDTTGGCTQVVGTPGHTYGFYVQTFDSSGRSWGPPGDLASATTTVGAGAPPAAAFAGLYAVDGNGLLHSGSSPPLPVTGHWPGWDIVRGMGLDADGLGGQVVDGFGGLHPFGDAPTLDSTAYWPGWDIVRGMVLQPSGLGGYVLDDFGGVHAIGDAPPVSITGYWPGWNIARAITLFPNGESGYVLDGFGGLHPFAAAGVAMPPIPSTAYWSGWDIARSVVLQSNGVGGYTMDGFGGVHPFGGAPPVTSTAYWGGWDIARSVVLATDTSGYVVDGFAGMHPFGGAPAVVTPFDTPNAYNVRGAALSR